MSAPRPAPAGPPCAPTSARGAVQTAVLLAAALLGGSPLAHGASPGQLDADLARLPAAPRFTLVIPRLDRILIPIADALTALQRQPDWALALGLPLSAFQARTGINLIDPGALAAAGLDLGGPLWAAGDGAGTLAALPVADGPQAARLGATLAGLPAELTGEGWRIGGLSLRTLDGRTLVSDRPEALAELQARPPSAGDPLAGCPHGPGGADLYLRFNLAALAAQGCLTLRLDPDRIRLDGRLRGPLLTGWLGAPVAPALAALPEGPTAALALQAGPKALARLKQLARRRGQSAGAAQLTGSLAASAGPGPQDLYLWAGLTPDTPPGIPAPARAALSQIVRPVPAGDGLDLFRREVEAEPVALGRAERQGAGLVLRGPGPPPRLGDLPASRRGRAVADPRLWTRAAFLLWLRLAGPPHDGQPYLDAVQPALRFLDQDLAHAARIAAGLAWITGHLGELLLAAWPEPDGLGLALEVVRL